MAEPEVMVEWLGGVKEWTPVEYRVTETETGPWWWRSKEYAIESDLGRLSGFSTKAEAESYAMILRRV